MPLMGMSVCHGCKKGFVFNPDLVPVVQFADGHQGPICKSCFALSNEKLEKQGAPLMVAIPGAWEPGE